MHCCLFSSARTIWNSSKTQSIGGTQRIWQHLSEKWTVNVSCPGPFFDILQMLRTMLSSSTVYFA